MGLIATVGKLLLVTVNVVLLIISLAMITIGVVFMAGKDLWTDLINKMQSKLDASITLLGAKADTSSLSLNEFLVPVAYILIVVGIVTGSLAILGCCGACYNIKLVLVLYVMVTSVIFLAQVGLAMVVYTDKSSFDNTIKPFLKATLKDYSGIEGTEKATLAWNALMNYKKCCGVDGYTDFHNLTSWPPSKIAGISVTALKTPVICCITKSITILKSHEGTCAQSPSNKNNYWKTGCYDKFFDLILGNSMTVTILISQLVVQFVLIFVTIWILCSKDGVN